MSGIPLDDLDHQLIDALIVDGRLSNRALAQRFGVAEGTVKTRLQRLNDRGVLHVRAHLDQRKLGLDVTAGVGIQVRPDHHNPVIEWLTSRPEVRLVATTLGRNAIFAGLLLRKHTQLADFTEDLRRLPGVTDVEVNQVVEIVKADPRWAKL